MSHDSYVSLPVGSRYFNRVAVIVINVFRTQGTLYMQPSRYGVILRVVVDRVSLDDIAACVEAYRAMNRIGVYLSVQ